MKFRASTLHRSRPRPPRAAARALVLLAVAGSLLGGTVAARPAKEEPKAPVPGEPVKQRAGEAPEAIRGPEGPVLLLVINGTINPAVADYIHDGIEVARQRQMAAVLIQMDTPGGLLDSTKGIVKEILGAPVPVIVYVAPSGGGAISAGVFITMAGHIAAMAPGTNIGAAHPVGPGGGDIEGDMREKVENFAVSLSRTIAQQRGRNMEWAEKAVRESVSITEQEAVAQNVVDFVAADAAELLRLADGREVEVSGRKIILVTAGAQLEKHEMRLRQKVIDLLAHPNVAYLLMMAGLLGLYVEFTHPGLFFPGVAGAICLLLGMAALQVLPINYSGLALIVLGVSLLIAELFLPSFGVLGVGGMVAFVFGSLLLFDTPESTVRVDFGVILGAAAALGAFSLYVGFLVVRSQRQRPKLGTEGMLGAIGQVRRTLEGNRAKVFVHGEYWDAESEEPLTLGDTVEVTGIEGLRVRVRRKP